MTQQAPEYDSDEMNRCKNCKHFTVDRPPHGSCARWRMGYSDFDNLPLNKVQVESDEGWGMCVGPEFGCILWEALAIGELASPKEER